MPDFSRWGANGGDPSLNAIARTDRYLDALASEQPVYATDPADAELADLMGGWRDEVRRPPATGVATQRDAEIILQRAAGARRRTRMSMAVAGSVAASLLCLGGFGAVVYGAGPGDAMYGLRTALFGEQQQTRTDQVALASQQLAEVQQLINDGQWDAAQDKLQTLTTTVATVNDVEQKQELVTQWQDLTVKVDAKDANATLPPGVPPPAIPEPAVVAPGSATSTTTPPEASSSTSSSSEASSSTSSPSEATTSSSSPSETTSSSPSAPKPPPPVQPPDDSSSSSSSSPKAPKPELEAPGPAPEAPKPLTPESPPKQLAPEAPAPEAPKPLAPESPPKQLAPEPKPAPAQEAPAPKPAPEAPPAPDAPAPKPAPADTPTTTVVIENPR
jgi:Anti-sigma-D factor RsdA to sigma factor binding region